MLVDRSICVFCGASRGENPAYADVAHTVGAGFGPRGWRLVYGAGDIGLMGVVADAAVQSGAATLGVMPAHLQQREVGKQNLDEFIITNDMHERKQLMYKNAAAIVLLPGGVGSLDEFFEALTWSQLDIHKKPIFILNTNEYWTPLITLINHVIDNGFAHASLKSLYHSYATADDLFAALEKQIGVH